MSGSFPQRVLCRRIAILDDSGDTLTRYASLAMQRELLELPFVDRVDYFPSGTKSPGGDRLADLIVRVERTRFNWFWLPFWYSCGLSVTVDTKLSPSMLYRARSNHRSGPVPWLQLDLVLGDSRSVRILGPSTHKVRAVGEELGVNLGAEISRMLEEKVESHGLLARLPDYAFGSYRDADIGDTPILRREGIEELMRGTAPFHHHASVWRFRSPGPQAALLDDAAREMVTAGWTMVSPTATQSGERQFVRGTRRVAIRALDGSSSRWSAGRWNDGATLDEPPVETPEESHRYLVHYLDEFGAAEYASFFERLIADHEQSLDDLVPFDALMRWHADGVFSSFVDLLAARPRSSARTHTFLAKVHQSDGRLDAAQERLQMAATLQRLRGDGALDDTLEEIAGELDARELLTQGGRSVYRALGFVELEPRPMEVAIEVGLDEPVFAYFDGPLGLICIGVELRRTRPAADAALELITYSPSIVSRRTIEGDPASDLIVYELAWALRETAVGVSHNAAYEVRRLGADRFLVRFGVEESTR